LKSMAVRDVLVNSMSCSQLDYHFSGLFDCLTATSVAQPATGLAFGIISSALLSSTLTLTSEPDARPAALAIHWAAVTQDCLPSGSLVT